MKRIFAVLVLSTINVISAAEIQQAQKNRFCFTTGPTTEEEAILCCEGLTGTELTECLAKYNQDPYPYD